MTNKWSSIKIMGGLPCGGDRGFGCDVTCPIKIVT